MAMRHRKLFPTTNQTVDCSEICDQTCPYGCYPYSDFYWMPPPPPAPPSTNKGHHISLYVIIIVTLFGCFLLLISCYAIIMKYCSRWTRVRSPPIQSDGPDEEFLDENRGPTIDHPIWYITTVGLQSSVINSITVFKYKKDDNLIEGTDCSVCLNEFQEDETLRLLPKCNHAFHIPCIDTWLRSHTNCPLCRAGIVSNNLMAPFGSNQQNLNGLGLDEETHMEISENNGELEMNQGRAETGDCENRVETGDCGNRTGTEDELELEFRPVDHETMEIENSKKNMSSNGNLGFWVVDNSRDNDMVMEDEIQPVRRSVSMNSAADIDLNVESEGSSVNPRVDVEKYDFTKRPIENSRILGMMGGSSVSQSLHKGPVSMKRSFSYGGRSFLSRHNRSANAILPL